MLMIAPIKPDLQAQIPAVTHVDGTGRVQTVTATANPYFHQLCHQLVALRQGPPVLMNTSFNIAGQPIVETPAEAIQTFLNTDIDYLALENLWISKRHVRVQNYEEHLSKVGDTVIPQGLPPHQPAVTDLMAQLDRALFFGEGDRSPWTETELKALSSIGARYKETSVLFPETPFVGPLHTRVLEDVVWVLDPLNQSTLVDLSEQGQPRHTLPGRLLNATAPIAAGQKPKPLSGNGFSSAVRLSAKVNAKVPRPFVAQGATAAIAYNFDEVKLLMAMLSQQTGWQDQLRLDLRLTHAELAQKLVWAQGQLAQHGLESPLMAPTGEMADSPIPSTSHQTLEPFGDDQFSLRQRLGQVRTCLQQAGYTLENICDRLGIDSLQAIEPTRLRYYDRYKLGQGDLEDLIRLFLLRVALPQARLQGLLGDDLVTVLIQLGVLVRRGDQWASRVDVFCVEGLYIATDHRYMLLSEDRISENPVMYVGADSQGLVYTAPRYPAKQVLDLCCGSGIQGLVASRYAQQVTAVDLNPSAIRFARFNAQLNDIRNIQFHHGSLYAPVGARRFDTILANPPFVPSPKRDLGFRDGGATGEEILAEIIQPDLFARTKPPCLYRDGFGVYRDLSNQAGPLVAGD